MTINPEILSNKATHTHRKHGLVKVFTYRKGFQPTDQAGNPLAMAEIMEGPSKGKWTTVTLNNGSLEKLPEQGLTNHNLYGIIDIMKKAFVFDFDDTLATTSCMVKVMDNNNQCVTRLTPAEYNTHKLHDDFHYDYSEFQDGDFIAKAVATFLIHLAKEVHDEGHSVYILTARHDAISDAVDEWLLLSGIQAKAIHCVGNSTDNIETAKQKILWQIIDRYDRTYFYDDCEANITHAPQHENMRAYKV